MAAAATAFRPEVTYGSPLRFGVTLLQTSGDAVDLTGYGARLTIRTYEDSTPLYTGTDLDDITIADPTTGQAIVAIPGATTGGWAPFEYARVYFSVVEPGGEIIPMLVFTAVGGETLQ